MVWNLPLAQYSFQLKVLFPVSTGIPVTQNKSTFRFFSMFALCFFKSSLQTQSSFSCFLHQPRELLSACGTGMDILICSQEIVSLSSLICLISSSVVQTMWADGIISCLSLKTFSHILCIKYNNHRVKEKFKQGRIKKFGWNISSFQVCISPLVKELPKLTPHKWSIPRMELT